LCEIQTFPSKNIELSFGKFLTQDDCSHLSSVHKTVCLSWIHSQFKLREEKSYHLQVKVFVSLSAFVSFRAVFEPRTIFYMKLVVQTVEF